MLAFILPFLIYLNIAQGLSFSLSNVTKADVEVRVSSICAMSRSNANVKQIDTAVAEFCNFTSVPHAWLRAYSSSAHDHFYTVDGTEMQKATTTLGYAFEAVTGYVFTTQETGSIPLYRLYSGKASDHFYTADAQERDKAISKFGYTYEGISGYVFASGVCGTQPLYRMYSPGQSDHFYTMSATESSNAARGGVYGFEGIAGYIYP